MTARHLPAGIEMRPFSWRHVRCCKSRPRQLSRTIAFRFYCLCLLLSYIKKGEERSLTADQGIFFTIYDPGVDYRTIYAHASAMEVILKDRDQIGGSGTNYMDKEVEVLALFTRTTFIRLYRSLQDCFRVFFFLYPGSDACVNVLARLQ
jgi:hypothetical protein